MTSAKGEIAKIDDEIQNFTETGLLEDFDDATVQERMDKMRDPKTGRLNEGWNIISVVDARKMHNKPGDHLILARIPSADILSAGYEKIAAILPESKLKGGQIITNSERWQGVVGEDFDFDKKRVTPISRLLPELAHKQLGEAIEKSHIRHKRVIPSIYDGVLGKVSTGEGLGTRGHTFADTLNPAIRLKFMQKVLGSPKDAGMSRKLFDILGDNNLINNKFRKEVGLPVNRRILFTAFSQMGLTSTVRGQKIDVRHPGKNKNYVVLGMKHIIQ